MQEIKPRQCQCWCKSCWRPLQWEAQICCSCLKYKGLKVKYLNGAECVLFLSCIMFLSYFMQFCCGSTYSFKEKLFVLYLGGRSAWRCPRCTWNPADPKQQVLCEILEDNWYLICIPGWRVYLGRVGGGENGTGDEDEDDHPHLHSPDLRSCTISRIRIRNQDHGPGSTFHSHLPSWYLI